MSVLQTGPRPLALRTPLATVLLGWRRLSAGAKASKGQRSCVWRDEALVVRTVTKGSANWDQRSTAKGMGTDPPLPKEERLPQGGGLVPLATAERKHRAPTRALPVPPLPSFGAQAKGFGDGRASEGVTDTSAPPPPPAPLTLAEGGDALLQRVEVAGEARHPAQVLVVLPFAHKVLHRKGKKWTLIQSAHRDRNRRRQPPASAPQRVSQVLLEENQSG